MSPITEKLPDIPKRSLQKKPGSAERISQILKRPM